MFSTGPKRLGRNGFGRTPVDSGGGACFSKRRGSRPVLPCAVGAHICRPQALQVRKEGDVPTHQGRVSPFCFGAASVERLVPPSVRTRTGNRACRTGRVRGRFRGLEAGRG